MRVLRIMTTLMFLGFASAQSQDKTVDALIARALQSPNDSQTTQRAIGAWNNSFDPRLIPAFRELFQLLSEKRARQLLAVVMLNHGQRDQMYFDELARYAREAIATTAPYPFLKDELGNDIVDTDRRKPRLNPAFIAWCEAKGMQPKECLGVVIDYPVDVMRLVAANDPRAIALLREGLRASFDTTVRVSAWGLGKLNDVESIPLIAANLERFPPGSAESIATALAEFDDPRVGPLLDRYVKNPKLRQELREKIRKRQSQGKSQ